MTKKITQPVETSKPAETTSGRKPEMTAYQVERLSEDRSFWNRIGVAWLCKDGSYNIKLFALPTSGEFNLRPRKEEEEQ